MGKLEVEGREKEEWGLERRELVYKARKNDAMIEESTKLLGEN